MQYNQNIVVAFHYNFIKKSLLCISMTLQLTLFSSIEHSDTIYKRFVQLLGPLYQYECKALSGGQMSSIQLCMVNGKKYVARVINTPLPVRRNEVLTHVHMASKNIAPHIHYYDQDDYALVIMDYLEGKTLSWQQARNHDVLQRIAHKIRSIQACDKNTLMHDKRMNIFDFIINCYEKIKTKKFAIDPAIFDQAFHKAKILYDTIESRKPRLVLSHNDLHPRNIFFINNDISIIDWEVIGLNYELFDLALYSLYSCLRDEDEYHLLTYYLYHEPSDEELQQFKDIKLLISLYGSFWNFAFSDEIPEDISFDMVNDFDYYGKIFTETYDSDSPKFWFEFSASLLQKFFKDYERFELAILLCY